MPSNRLLIRTKTAVTSILLCFLTALIVALAPAPAQAATGEYTDEQGVKYTYTSYGEGTSSVNVTSIYSDQETHVVVPDTINGLTVRKVELSGDTGTITSLDMTKCTGLHTLICNNNARPLLIFRGARTSQSSIALTASSTTSKYRVVVCSRRSIVREMTLLRSIFRIARSSPKWNVRIIPSHRSIFQEVRTLPS